MGIRLNRRLDKCPGDVQTDVYCISSADLVTPRRFRHPQRCQLRHLPAADFTGTSTVSGSSDHMREENREQGNGIRSTLS